MSSCVPKLYRSATLKETHWIALAVGLGVVGFTYEILMTLETFLEIIFRISSYVPASNLLSNILMSVLAWNESSDVFCRGLIRTSVIDECRNIVVDNFMVLLEYISRL